MMPSAAASTAALTWWSALQPDPDSGKPGDRAALARLRRCTVLADAMAERATLVLFRRLGCVTPAELPAVALTAAVLAHVRQNTSGASVARLIGPDSIETPETALMKPLRFRRLMEAQSWDDRLIAFRRLTALTGGALPVSDLAVALLRWSDWRRQCWVFDYWNAGPLPEPATPEPVARRPVAPRPVAKDARS